MPKADNLPPSCALFTKSGNLNFLEPSGPLRACNGPGSLCLGRKTDLIRAKSVFTAVKFVIMPDTVDTVLSAADDGWRYRPKHVEQSTDIYKQYTVAFCWIIIDNILCYSRSTELKMPDNYVSMLAWWSLLGF